MKIQSDAWFVSHAVILKNTIRMVFGLVWAIDASFKFQPSFINSFPSLIASAAAGQPSWLSGWFTFWQTTTSSNPALFAYSVAILESALAFSLIFGFMRKIAYGGGFFFSLVIWSIPEGFGGPYGPSSTDIGTSIIYAFVFLLLAIISATYGTSKYSLDALIEKRVSWWHKIAEIKQG
ncbi:DoxX family protein [Cuniculiplasma divulgatum]|uniref:DoxX family multipass membrane protein n=1 Tax=Cuniculiplasma divulgatum TaxID=1673428 RepID=A0A1N5S391_9ARCH|nr:DoxX family protein [Cuniculiplasma divulgatum]SIM30532.1 DoxX family multipass membrane protein [Cuniculiplasma divulgatum]